MNKKGFTYIEVIVTFSIMLMFFGLSISFYNSYNNSSLINLDANQLKSDINKIITNAKSSYSNTRFTENNDFGIYFNILNPDEYILYKDLNLNHIYNSNERIQNIALENSKINYLPSGTSFDLLFRTNGDNYINGVYNNSNSDYYISIINGNKTKNISINPFTSIVKIQ
jgi:type II secretory pathway pseudopilin PulG